MTRYKAKKIIDVHLSLIALRVIPSHSYCLSCDITDRPDRDGEQTERVILGNPNLNVHGPINGDDSGISFDGVDTWLDATFKNNDCLINPGLCPDGFTVSFKAQFSKEALNSTEKRFILDSGGNGGMFPGVAVYLQSGSLHCQLTTSNWTWTVCHEIFKILLLVFFWPEMFSKLAFLKVLE